MSRVTIDDILHPAYGAEQTRKHLDAEIARIDLELGRCAEIRGRGIPRPGKCTCWGAHECDDCKSGSRR